MIEIFQRLLKSQDAGWNQTQKEAMVDLLLLGMYADGSLSLVEQDFIQKEGTQIQWESGISFSGYLERTIPKVRNAQADAAARVTFLDGIRDRLGSVVNGEKALAELQSLLQTDGVVPLEEAFIAEVSELLGLAA